MSPPSSSVGRGADAESAYAGRKLAATLATVLTTAAVVLALLPLFGIFVYVATQGLRALNLSFFTESIGAQSSGMANAIVGTIELFQAWSTNCWRLFLSMACGAVAGEREGRPG